MPGEDGERPRSRKELIEELIAKSKQEKVRWLRQRHGPPCVLALSFPVHFQAVFAPSCEFRKSMHFEQEYLKLHQACMLLVARCGSGFCWLVGWCPCFDVYPDLQNSTGFTHSE